MSTADLLSGHSSDWRVARWLDNADVVVIEFPGLASQGRAMNRLAALLEKADAPRDRVLDDAQLEAVIVRSADSAPTFYLGHDYDGAGLARFFSLARRQGVRLNAEEQRLLHTLQVEGVLRAEGDGWQAIGSQALVTFTSVQPDDPATPQDESIDARRRASILRHELSHGIFFTRADYRERARRFWRETLDEPLRERLRTHLARLGYDRGNEELMLNETQALMMHTEDTRAFDASAIGLRDEELARLRERFWRDGEPPSSSGTSRQTTRTHPSATPNGRSHD